MLEVGAGTGELTSVLAKRAAAVAAVELDEALCRALRTRFADQAAVRVVNANVLQHPPLDLLREAGLSPPYIVAANIPYYITAPILRHFLEASAQPRRLVLTVQREVADALVARPGSMSLLGASVQFYADVELLFLLKPESFRPPPKVDSAVVRITVAPTPKVQVRDVDEFFQIVRAGFRSPRKQLHNALGQGIWLPSGEADPLLRAAGIDPMRRAQTLSLDEWAAVERAYSERRRHWTGEAGQQPPRDGLPTEGRSGG